MNDRTRPLAASARLATEIAALRRGPLADETHGQQCERTSRIIDRFCLFASTGHGVKSLEEVTASIAEAFIHATTGTCRIPSIPTVHWRRTALRLLFRAARHAGLVDGDPTLDLELPPRSSLSTRPLTHDEVALCRSVAQWSLHGSRRAAVWALAEATCRSSELPHVTADDVDLDSGRVWIAGGKASDQRKGYLTEWGIAHVRSRIEELGEPTRPRVYSGRSPAGAGQVSEG